LSKARSTLTRRRRRHARRVQTALEVLSDDVTIYGLAAEHTLGDLVLWRGERGRVYFYQCELPYDVATDTFGSEWPCAS
jgi:hypothetical protein